MSVFVDTSALLAVLDADEERHSEAAKGWRRIIAEDEALLATNYVLVETFAIVQRRLGLAAIRLLQRDVMPLIAIEWIGEEVHAAALGALLAANRAGLSLVDCSSFEVMRRRGVMRAFAFDRHFAEQGFETL